MQQVISSMIGYTVRGTDGDLGEVRGFYFDDATWSVRYMVVETGKWLSGRKTLLSIASLEKINCASRTFNVNLNREQVRNSPDTDIDEPVSRKYEIALHGHYEWNSYWSGGFYVPGYGVDTFLPTDGIEREDESSFKVHKVDSRLCSTQEMSGYRIHATDGDIGHVEDFIVDEGGWDIRYLVVDTRNWLPGRRVIVSPQWIKRVDWEDSKVFVDVSRDAVKKSPVYAPSKLISLDYERKLLEHLRKPEDAAWVTFKIHAPEGAKVFLAGTFNKWDSSSIRLERGSHGVYETTVLVPAGRSEYKFIVNGNWCNAPDCKEQTPNAFGTANSVLFVGQHEGHHKGHLHTFSRFSAGQNRPLWSTPTGG
ncbi:MAG: PRC-barrel domain-containing protein [Victivallales bacterium]